MALIVLGLDVSMPTLYRRGAQNSALVDGVLRFDSILVLWVILAQSMQIVIRARHVQIVFLKLLIQLLRDPNWDVRIVSLIIFIVSTTILRDFPGHFLGLWLIVYDDFRPRQYSYWVLSALCFWATASVNDLFVESGLRKRDAQIFGNFSFKN